MATASAVLAEPIRQEPIHDSKRIFTADEFRDYIKTLRFQQALEQLGRKKMSSEQQKKLADFAQRLLDQSRSPDTKKDLKVPEELLQNPAIQKLMKDGKFLDKLLENKSLMDLAERIARNYNLPNNSRGIDAPWDQFSRKPGDKGKPNSATPPGGRPTAGERGPGGKGNRPNRAANSQYLPGLGDQDGATDSEGPIAAGVPGARGEGVDSGANDGGGQPGRRGKRVVPSGPTTENELLRRWTEKAQRSGVLKGSRALEQFEQKLQQDAGERTYIGPRVDLPDTVPSWPELPTTKPVENVMERVRKLSLKDIPLPPGLADWAPSLGHIPLPKLPNRNVGFAAPPLPRVPSFALSPPSARGTAVFAGGLAAVAALFFLAAFLRPRLGTLFRLDRNAYSRSAASIRPAEPLDPTNRSSIRAWFEYLALVCLGESARPQNHLAIAQSLRTNSSSEARSAVELADLYEQARYLPPDEPVESNLASSGSGGYDRPAGNRID